MHCCFLPALLGLVSVALATTAQDTPQNLDFEQGVPGATPPGWICPTPGYTIELVDTNPLQGKHCVRLASSGAAPAAPFGNVLQGIDAVSYRGKTLRFRAAVRVGGASQADRAQLWLRVDRPADQTGFFDNMGDRPISDPTWKYYDIVGPVAPDAVALTVGCMLLRRGELFLDDVTLTIVDDAPAAPSEPPRPLAGRGLENLVAFGKLLGYVRYFHPSDAAAATDWSDFAVRGVRSVEAAENPFDLAQALERLFQPIAPSVVVAPQPPGAAPVDRPAPPANADTLRLAAWRHHGVGTGAENSIYRSVRVFEPYAPGTLPEGFADPLQPFAAQAGGVCFRVPLTLFADERGTLPHTATQPAAVVPRFSGNDRATRLADVLLAWNVFQHFYPYFDVVQTDWEQALRDALTRAATDADERAFLDTLRLLVAALHDGHGFVAHASDGAQAALPLLWDWVEDRLVLTQLAPDTPGDTANGLQIGDVVTRVNGRPAAEALADEERFCSGATPQWRRHAALERLRLGRPGAAANLEVQPAAGPLRPVTLPYGEYRVLLREQRPAKIAQVRPGIWYVDLDRINDAEFTQALSDLAGAQGLVFDLRGYPSNLSPIVLAHLTDRLITSPEWHIPLVTRPDHAAPRDEQSGWPVMPAPPRLSAKAAFVTDGRAISYAETYLGIVEHYKLAEIVGGPTAGTNGNVNTFTLPGDYRIGFTGMKVLKHGGGQHHGVGIQPTVPAQRTLAGIRAGRDELLEKAIEVVSTDAR